MSRNVLLEISLDSVVSAIAAEKGGAARVELCSNLAEGGITPDAGLIKLTRKSVFIPLFIIIRPRPGDFSYSDSEFEIMKRDIILAKKLGAEGVVVGILRADGTIDIDRMKTSIQLARPMQVTFHRAFDIASDPFSALDDLIRLGIERLLTSGQCKSAFEGMQLIAELGARANNRITIMPGCGIHRGNIQAIRKKTGAAEFHIGTAAHAKQDGGGRLQFGSNGAVDAAKVKELVDLLNIN
jgi:copper homeostasis protein